MVSVVHIHFLYNVSPISLPGHLRSQGWATGAPTWVPEMRILGGRRGSPDERFEMTDPDEELSLVGSETSVLESSGEDQRER